MFLVLVHYWYMAGTQLVHGSWYTLVRGLYTAGTQLVHGWYTVPVSPGLSASMETHFLFTCPSTAVLPRLSACRPGGVTGDREAWGPGVGSLESALRLFVLARFVAVGAGESLTSFYIKPGFLSRGLSM